MEQEPTDEPTSIEHLPDEIILQIFEKLSVKDLQSMALANMRFNALACETQKILINCKPIMKTKVDWEYCIDEYSKSAEQEDIEYKNRPLSALINLAHYYNEKFNLQYGNPLNGYRSVHYFYQAFLRSNREPSIKEEIAKAGLEVINQVINMSKGTTAQTVLIGMDWLTSIIRNKIHKSPYKSVYMDREELLAIRLSFQDYLRKIRLAQEKVKAD